MQLYQGGNALVTSNVSDQLRDRTHQWLTRQSAKFGIKNNLELMVAVYLCEMSLRNVRNVSFSISYLY